ncbi:hypothetical protein IJH97_01325 [Candidatus Saccharibacteria bacterium]|nr:hypothetical protein [Candidatus Saccharibacteria bacterium]
MTECEIKKDIIVNGRKLTLAPGGKGKIKRSGLNYLKNIEYIVYTFDQPLHGYDCILLMFFRVDEKAQEAASKNVVPGGKGVTLIKTPHIDGRTGNIHPGVGYVDENRKDKVAQLVLARKTGKKPGSHAGPNTPEIEETDDIYNYGPKTKVHKSCYYPRIDGKEPKNDWRYEFLKEAWEKIFSPAISSGK